MEEIPLVVFRPEIFYRWLFRQWHRRSGLSQASQEAISELHPLFARNGTSISSENSIRHLLTVVDCAAALNALSNEDFIAFINFALEEGFLPGIPLPDVPIGYDNLDTSPAKLRQQLARYYDQERLWPHQGFRPLLNEALAAACQAEKAVHLAANAVAISQRERAARETHDGIDRCLLCVEHFLELIVEFAAQAAGQIGLADDETLKEWLKHAGIGLTRAKEDRGIDWDGKQKKLQTIRKEFEHQEQMPENWEHFWPALLRLLNHFRAGDPDQEGLRTLRQLQRHRNAVRHASHTLVQAKTVPSAYKDTLPGIRKAIEDLLTSSLPLLPGTAKIVEYRRDFTGAVELLLTTEDKRLVTLRYDNERDAYEISGVRLSDLSDRLVFASQEQEYFLFPMPQVDEHLIVNALLLSSARLGETVLPVKLKLETVAPLAVQAEFAEETVGGA